MQQGRVGVPALRSMRCQRWNGWTHGAHKIRSDKGHKGGVGAGVRKRAGISNGDGSGHRDEKRAAVQ